MVCGNTSTGTTIRRRYCALSCLVWNPIRCSKLTPSVVMSQPLNPQKETLLTAQLHLSTMLCSAVSVLTGPLTKVMRICVYSKDEVCAMVQYHDLSVWVKVSLTVIVLLTALWDGKQLWAFLKHWMKGTILAFVLQEQHVCKAAVKTASKHKLLLV